MNVPFLDFVGPYEGSNLSLMKLFPLHALGLVPILGKKLRPSSRNTRNTAAPNIASVSPMASKRSIWFFAPMALVRDSHRSVQHLHCDLARGFLRRCQSGPGQPIRALRILILPASSGADFKTKAIMPVHLYGQPADMDPIMKSPKHGLKVIEDNAQAQALATKGAAPARSDTPPP
jgi:hypothetical protein